MIPSQTEALRNFDAAWEQVTDQDREIGEASYPSYHDTLRGFSDFYEQGFVPTVEAFAALSPNNDYHGNLRSLAVVLYAVAANVPFEDLTISTYRGCGDRALTYLRGEVSFLDAVGGKKITAFRHNLLYPTRSKEVTVDGHMVAIWTGTRDMTMKQAAAVFSDAQYPIAANHIRTFARRVKMLPCAVQATLWVSRKRRQGIKFDAQEDLFSGETRWQEIATPQHYPPYQTKAWRDWAKSKGHDDV